MASRQCLMAVNRTVRHSGLEDGGRHSALIEHARNLARRMDKAGQEEAPLNLVRLYDSAITKLARAAATMPAPKPTRAAGEPEAEQPASPVSPPSLSIVEESPLDQIRRNKARAAAAG